MKHIRTTWSLAASNLRTNWSAVIGAVLWTTVHADPVTVTEHSPGFELTPFVSFNMGGSLQTEGQNGTPGNTVQRLILDDRGAFALALDLKADEGSQYELFYSREATILRGGEAFAATNIAVEYLHLGGKIEAENEMFVKPYVVGGIGATRFNPAQANTDTRLSISLGVGLRLPVSRHFSVRLEARGFGTLVKTDSDLFCQSDRSGLLCRIHGRGDGFFQGEVLAGAALAF
jgi:opacity protein-like surface antigen